MKIAFILILTVLFSCETQKQIKPKDKLQAYRGEITDFTKVTGQFNAQRFYFDTETIDSVRVDVDNGVITKILRSDGSSYSDSLILNSNGEAMETAYGLFKLNIYEDYNPNIKIIEEQELQRQINQVKVRENLNTDKIDVEPQIESTPEQTETVTLNPKAAKQKEEVIYYYKIDCDPNFGVKSLKCQKYDNSIGESCQEIGSLKMYGKCVGAFVWNQGNKIGGVMWTKNKIAYEAYEGEYNSGSWIIYEIPSSKIGIEEITYCTPTGNQIEIHTTNGVFVR